MRTDCGPTEDHDGDSAAPRRVSTRPAPSRTTATTSTTRDTKCSDGVIGWNIDEHMRSDLVKSALAMVVGMRGELAETVIVHADRGSTHQRRWRGWPAGTI